MANNRDKAYRGQTVRLYSYFYENGTLSDPLDPGDVYILDGTGSVAKSSLTAYHPSAGTYYVEWAIPSDQSPAYYYDVWSGIQLLPSSPLINRQFAFPVLYAPTEDIPIPDAVAVLSGLCRVYEFFMAGNLPLTNVIARGSIVELPKEYYGAYFVNYEEDVENYTDSNGRVDWYFPRGATVHIEVRAAGISELKLVPNQSSVQLSDMEDA